MDFNLWSPSGGDLEIKVNSPEKNLPFKLAGSQTDTVKGSFGSLYFHHVKTEGISIWSSVYDIKEPTILNGSTNEPVLEAHGSMENKISMSWDGIIQSAQREDQYNMSFVPFVNNEVKFEAGTRVRTMDFHVLPVKLQPFAEHYRLVDKFLTKIENREHASLVKEDCIITPHMRECLYRIDDYYCHPGMAGSFYNCKVHEFLSLLVDRATYLSDKRRHPFKFTAIHKSRTETGRDFLISDFSECPTVEKVAEKALLNETILKKCFKFLYGKPIHQYFIEKKMEFAKNLLLNPDLPMHEIYSKLGYQDKQYFYNSFKKYFNKTPGQWCKENDLKRGLILLGRPNRKDCRICLFVPEKWQKQNETNTTRQWLILLLRCGRKKNFLKTRSHPISVPIAVLSPR